MAARYLTTTLPYVNADPHIGFALEIVQADALARFWRLSGDTVFFTTGTDEHGQKIFEKAKESGEEVQAYVDRYAASFSRLKEGLNLSNDAFIRTTDPVHIAAAQEMWKRCEAQGDIYKKKYSGLYCTGCEKFVTEKDLVEGRCPQHPQQVPQMVEEENYFFALSKYQRGLLDHLSRDGVVVPEHRREEARRFVAEGLEDFSISREKSRMPWGVPVPGDESQVMYVWFDALANYISTLGWPNEGGNFKTFWQDGEVLQVAGKDQVRFQSIMWQAMLMSAGIKNTDTVFYHGFVNSGGQKMSKSLGNVISPFTMVEKYGTDATRYMVLKHIHPMDDTDVTWERMDEWYTANLVNGLGNLVARVTKLSETHEVQTMLPNDNSVSSSVAEHMAKFRFDDAMGVIWQLIQRTDQRITEEEPFKVIKTDQVTGKAMIQNYVQDVYRIAVALEPFMPEVAEKIQIAVRENKKPENLFPRLA